jgi:hypothetical protein
MNQVFLGFKHHLIPLPEWLFIQALKRETRKAGHRLGGLDEDHRRVHHFVVRELPRLAAPMPPTHVSDALGLDLKRVIEILDELEHRKVFLFSPGGRDVVWAYPVTVEKTPHRVTFSTGERINAA